MTKKTSTQIETELAVTKAIAAAKDEFRRDIDSMRIETKSHSTRLTLILAVVGSIVAVLSFFGFKETVSNAIDEEFKKGGYTAVKKRAEKAVEDAEGHAQQALKKLETLEKNRTEANGLLGDIRKRDAESKDNVAERVKKLEAKTLEVYVAENCCITFGQQDEKYPSNSEPIGFTDTDDITPYDDLDKRWPIPPTFGRKVVAAWLVPLDDTHVANAADYLNITAVENRLQLQVQGNREGRCNYKLYVIYEPKLPE